MSLETNGRLFPVVRGRGEKGFYISGQRPHVSGDMRFLGVSRDTVSGVSRDSVSGDKCGWPALKMGVT